MLVLKTWSCAALLQPIEGKKRSISAEVGSALFVAQMAKISITLTVSPLLE
jgi:hypothetical protein